MTNKQILLTFFMVFTSLAAGIFLGMTLYKIVHDLFASLAFSGLVTLAAFSINIKIFNRWI